MSEQEELEKEASKLQEQTQKRIHELEEFVKQSAKRTECIMGEEEDDGLDHIDLDDGEADEQPTDNPYLSQQNPFTADTKLEDLDRRLSKIKEEDSTEQRVQSILQKVRERQQAATQSAKHLSL